MLWFRLSHLPLQCTPYTTKLCDFSRRQRTIQVTVRVNIDVVHSAVYIRRLVKNNHVVHLFVNSNTAKTQTLYLPRSPTETLTKQLPKRTLFQDLPRKKARPLDPFGFSVRPWTSRTCQPRATNSVAHSQVRARLSKVSLRIPKGMFMAHAISSRGLAPTSSVSRISFPSPCRNADLASAHRTSA